ncbi:hypothetical protein V8E55_009295 [Tylopilus felleus]
MQMYGLALLYIAALAWRIACRDLQRKWWDCFISRSSTSPLQTRRGYSTSDYYRDQSAVYPAVRWKYFEKQRPVITSLKKRPTLQGGGDDI